MLNLRYRDARRGFKAIAPLIPATGRGVRDGIVAGPRASINNGMKNIDIVTIRAGAPDPVKPLTGTLPASPPASMLS